MELWTALLAWGAAQPLFLQVCLGLVLFLAVYTAASVALVAALLGVCWVARIVVRRAAARGRADTGPGVPAALGAWIAHAIGATWVAWYLTRNIWP